MVFIKFLAKNGDGDGRWPRGQAHYRDAKFKNFISTNLPYFVEIALLNAAQRSDNIIYKM